MSDNPETPEVDDAEPNSREERLDTEPEGDQGARPDDPFDPARAKAKIAKANSEAANLRKRLEAAESRLQEIDDASKSEDQKREERHAALEKRALEAELRALRLEVAAEKGLTTAQAKRLVGATREELEADADDLLETFAPKPSPAAPVLGRPREKLRGGGDPDEPVEETDPRKLAALIRRGN